MKKIISILLSFALLLVCFPISTNAEAVCKISVTSAAASRNDTIEISVNIGPNSLVQACGFVLHYDKDVLQIVGIEKGSVVSGNPIINTNQLGKITYSYASTAPIVSGGSMAKIVFKINPNAAYGESDLILEVTELSDGDFNKIPCTAVSGKINIIAPALDCPSYVDVIEVEDTYAAIQWEGIEGATGYNVYLNGELFNAEPLTDNTCTFYFLSQDTEYFVEVTSLHYSTESNKSPAYTIQTEKTIYSVTFVDWSYGTEFENEKSVIEIVYVECGGDAMCSQVPSREGYAFAGWDKASDNITEHTVIQAQYEPIVCAVTFVDWDGTVLSEQTVSYGGAAEAPANPTRDGYVFTMWDRSFDNVTEDITVTAQYMEITCAHKNVETQGMVKSTCTVNGYSGNVVCSDCNSVIMTGSELPLADHSYNSVVTKPTPSAQGYTTHTCTVCGHSYVDSYVDYVDENAPQLVLESKQVTKGKEFTVAVQFKNNPGFSYLEVTPIIAPELTLVKVTNGNLAADFTKGKQYVWVGDGDITADGVLMTFTFSVADSVAFGTYQVDFNVRTCANYDEEVLELAVVKADIEVIDCAYGDINGDGAIDGLDVIRLKKYLANYDYETESSDVEISAGADANGDGVIDGLDVIRLKKYLANYDYETGESTVVLGPQ